MTAHALKELSQRVRTLVEARDEALSLYEAEMNKLQMLKSDTTFKKGEVTVKYVVQTQQYIISTMGGSIAMPLEELETLHKILCELF